MISLSTKDVKVILQIEESDYDEYIETMLPLTIDMVEDYCNDAFALRTDVGLLAKVDNAYVIREGGLIIPIAKIIQFYMHESGVTQESISRVMYSYSNELPKSVTQALNSYRRVKWV